MEERLEDIAGDSGFFREILDSFPSPVFIVDFDVRIHFANRSARKMMDAEMKDIHLRRGGDALRCVNSLLHPEGCGHAEECRKCVVRNSVGRSMAGDSTEREMTVMRILGGGSDVHLMVTVSPLRHGSKSLSILVVEDVTELVRLRGLLPICAWCKRIRNDKDYWQSIEEYFREKHSLKFTHGICPECAEKFLKEKSDMREA